jgi:hypothetical protein
MPLVPQQAVIESRGMSVRDCMKSLQSQLQPLPEVRIISIATHKEVGGLVLIAVVETT